MTSNVAVFNTIVTSSLPSSVVPKVKPLHQSNHQQKQSLSASTVAQPPTAWQPKTNHNGSTLFSSARDSSSSPVTGAEESSSIKSPPMTAVSVTTKQTTVTRKASHLTAQANNSLQQHTSTDVAKQLAKAINKEKENQQVSERQLLSLSMTASLTSTSQQQQTSWPELLSQDEHKAMPSEQQKLVPRTFHDPVNRSPLPTAPYVSSMIRMPSAATHPARTLPYFAATQAPSTSAVQATPTVIRESNVTVTSTVTHKPVISVTQAATSRAYISSFSVPTSMGMVTAGTTPTTLSSTTAPIAANIATPPHIGTATFNLEMPLVHLPQPPFQLYADGENNKFFEQYGRMVSVYMCVGLSVHLYGVSGCPLVFVFHTFYMLCSVLEFYLIIVLGLLT